ELHYGQEKAAANGPDPAGSDGAAPGDHGERRRRAESDIVAPDLLPARPRECEDDEVVGPDRDELVVTQHRHVEAFAGIQPPNTADLPERSLPGPRAGRQEREAAVRDQQEEDQSAWERH